VISGTESRKVENGEAELQGREAELNRAPGEWTDSGEEKRKASGVITTCLTGMSH